MARNSHFNSEPAPDMFAHRVRPRIRFQPGARRRLEENVGKKEEKFSVGVHLFKSADQESYRHLKRVRA